MLQRGKGKAMLIVEVRAHVSEKNSEVLLGAGENPECAVEVVTSLALLELFECVDVKDVRIRRSPDVSDVDGN
jgi:hypothetical protein